MNRWWLVAALAAVCVGALLIFSCGRTEHNVNNYYDDDDSGDDDVSADDYSRNRNSGAFGVEDLRHIEFSS